MGIRKTPAPGDYGFDRLLHPANAFAHPINVVDDQDLTLTEKRAILASWASDAAEAAPALCPDDVPPVHFDDVMAALKELDRRCGDLKSVPRYRRILEHRVPGVFGRGEDKPGPALI